MKIKICNQQIKIIMEPKYCQKCDQVDKDLIPACPLLCMDPRCKPYQASDSINSEVTPVFWVLGGPGVGKGTQCAKLAKNYQFAHVSTGELLRAEVESGSDRSKCLQNVMKRGALVPTEVIIDLLKNAMLKSGGVSKGFLIDGYPREPEQCNAFEKKIAKVTGILFFEASKQTMLNRLRNRMMNNARSDDNEETIQNRLELFEKHKDSVVKKYGDKVLRVNAEGKPEEIFQSAVKLMDPVVQNCQIYGELVEDASSNNDKNKKKDVKK